MTASSTIYLIGIYQGCIKCMRSPAMAMVQIENFCPFSDWLKNNLNCFINQSENRDFKNQSNNLKKKIRAPRIFFLFLGRNKKGLVIHQLQVPNCQ